MPNTMGERFGKAVKSHAKKKQPIMLIQSVVTGKLPVLGKNRLRL